MANRKSIVLLTCYDRFFGQGHKVWDSMDVDKLKQEFERYDYQVQELTFEEVSRDIGQVEDSFIFYSSTQKPGGYKDFIEDVLLILKQNGNKLIPSFDMFRAHENKGYQELLRQKYGIERPEGYYFSGSEDFKDEQDLDYPIVFKEPSGSLSSGVQLMKNEEEILSFLRNKERLNTWDRVKAFIKKFTGKKKISKKWYSHLTPRYRFILQEFIPGLMNDYKILVFNDCIYALEREVRKNDFRASGSGKFNFDVNIDDSLLSYAHKIYSKFDEPYISLDVVENNGRYSVIEFQGIHCGPVGVIKSPYYYKKRDNNRWEKINKRSNLEEKVVEAVVSHIES